MQPHEKPTRSTASTAPRVCRKGAMHRAVALRCLCRQRGAAMGEGARGPWEKETHCAAISSGLSAGFGGGSASSSTSTISHVASPLAELSLAGSRASSAEMGGSGCGWTTTRSARAGEGDGCATGTGAGRWGAGGPSPPKGAAYTPAGDGPAGCSDTRGCRPRAGPLATDSAVCPGRSGRSGFSGARDAGVAGGGIMEPRRAAAVGLGPPAMRCSRRRFLRRRE
eukprot:scaffold2516_cov108-Isochrysis_galbana.AAC.16